jgi:hypothetical protein
MHAIIDNVPMFAFQLGGWEIVLILAFILILVGGKRLPDIARGLGHGMRKGTGKFWESLDQGAIDAGESVGGIYGKPAAEALTPDNETAELYDPAALGHKQRRDNATKKGKVSWQDRLFRRIWHFVCKLLGQQTQ